MDWESLSEIVFGLLMKGRIAADCVRPDMFVAPYDEAVKAYQEGKITPEIMSIKLGYTAFNASMEASGVIPAGTTLDWLQLLEKAMLKAQLATFLTIASKKLFRGEDIEYAQIVEKFNLMEGKQVDGIAMSDIEEGTDPFQPSGWNALDSHIIGLPKSGLIVVGGAPAVGKTSFVIKLFKKFLQTYPDRKALMFTLEMGAEEFKGRAMDINKFTVNEQKRLIVFEENTGVEEIANKASKYKDENVGIVAVDFADLMIHNETSESEMANIYRTLAKLAKRLEIPVILLSQLSRAYSGGLPRPYHVRWTGMAEAMAWMILMLYNPNTDFHLPDAEDTSLPIVQDRAYILVWKIRGGIRNHENQPGAIQLDWDGKYAWADEATGWFKLHV